jgi:septum site-determining protein MinD
MQISNIKDMLEIPILGIIPEDDAIKESQAMKNSVIYTHPKSRAAKTYINTTKRLLGHDVKFDPHYRKGFFSKLLIIFKR